MAASQSSNDASPGYATGDRPSAAKVIERMRADLEAVTGAEIDRVSGIHPNEEGWQGTVDVVEVSRVPPTTDILATYSVTTDSAGSVLSFERLRRYRRSDGGEG
jgi:hypothetical protein